jgi:hypothetical protein
LNLESLNLDNVEGLTLDQLMEMQQQLNMAE